METPETAVGGDQLAPGLDGQRSEVSVGDVIAASPHRSAEVAEDSPVSSAGADVRRSRLLSQLFNRPQSNIQGSGVGEDAPVGNDAKETGEAGIAESEAAPRFDLLTKPSGDALMLRQVLPVGIDQDVYVSEDHFSCGEPP